MARTLSLLMTRYLWTPLATLSTLTLDGKGGFWVVEDTDRGLDSSWDLDSILAAKVPTRTAIPATMAGDPYAIQITWSPKYGRMMPLVEGVPGWRGVRWHSGNTPADTAGCLLAGTRVDEAQMTVAHSRAATDWLTGQFQQVLDGGGHISLAIRRDLPAWARWVAREA